MDDNLTLIGWLKLMAVCAAVLAAAYGLFFATCLVLHWVQGL